MRRDQTAQLSLGLSQRADGAMVGRSATTVCVWELGRHSPRRWTAERLADVLGLQDGEVLADIAKDREVRARERNVDGFPEPIEVPPEISAGTRPGTRHTRVHPHGCFQWALS